MFNLPVQSKYSLGPLLVIILSVVLAVTEPMSSQLFAYDRLKIENFQWWRLISGHFLHTNIPHLLLNTSGVVLLWALHGHYYTKSRYLVQFLVLCLGTSTGLYFFAEDMRWYVGLSGVLHGLFVIGAFFDIRHSFRSGWLLLIAIWGKVLHEQIYGANDEIAELIAANVAIDAHLFGTITGSLIVLYYLLTQTAKQKKSNA